MSLERSFVYIVNASTAGALAGPQVALVLGEENGALLEELGDGSAVHSLYKCRAEQLHRDDIHEVDVLYAATHPEPLKALRGVGSVLDNSKALCVRLDHSKNASEELHGFLISKGFVLLNPWAMKDRKVQNSMGFYAQAGLVVPGRLL